MKKSKNKFILDACCSPKKIPKSDGRIKEKVTDSKRKEEAKSSD